MSTIHHPSPFTSLPSADKNGFWVEAEIKAMQRSNGMGSHSPPLNCLPFLSNVWTESIRDKCCVMNLTPFLKETNQHLDDKLVTLVAEVHIEWNQHIFRVRISFSYFHGLNQHNYPKALRVYDRSITYSIWTSNPKPQVNHHMDSEDRKILPLLFFN